MAEGGRHDVPFVCIHYTSGLLYKEYAISNTLSPHSSRLGSSVSLAIIACMLDMGI